ncbi:hypothetical protein N8I74_04385 [Chitiniphilus purpureus]|uniref:Uncharacterized protein n=1 Tax=Chitiniphilus purpureus TaxID=2981137 RepID=A0ABY6DPI1_9NEIS|nr:hypothetical protein [Chitiniphilus sp. CD1]UXY16264.1 hypothetical protein N8I74_04385 [Chitiniphilus sp. CD1]
MQHATHALALAMAAGLLMQPAQAEEARLAAAADNRATQVRINCANEPMALKKAVEKKVWADEKVKFVISGECQGPLRIDRHGVEIISDPTRPGTVRVSQPTGDQSAILVQSGSARLANFHINVPLGMAAVTAQANSSVEIDRITTNAKADWNVPLAQFNVTDSSSLFLANLNSAPDGNDVLVIGASSAEFKAGNELITLDVRDTSMAKSSAPNRFKAVQTSANGYFLADHKTRVDALAIWGKSSVEITRESSVGKLDMGGQTQFAAYGNSSVSGPYGIYGNVIIELNHSSATEWYTVNNPHAMFIGNNATVNEVFYPSWSWAGQGKQPNQP